MSSTLQCTLVVNSERTSWYWWPLIFEAMHRIDFAFDAPRLSHEHRGAYLGWDETRNSEIEADRASFRDMWDHASELVGSLLVAFWPTRDPVFEFDASVQSASNGEVLNLRFSLPIESLLVEQVQDSQRTAAERLARWLKGVSHLYDLCGPCEGELAWERWGSHFVIGSIGQPNRSFRPEELHLAYAQSVAERAVAMPLSHNGVLHLIDPLPVPWRGQWTLIALADVLDGPVS